MMLVSIDNDEVKHGVKLFSKYCNLRDNRTSTLQTDTDRQAAL